MVRRLLETQVILQVEEYTLVTIHRAMSISLRKLNTLDGMFGTEFALQGLSSRYCVLYDQIYM